MKQPPIFLISCSFDKPWITEPAPKNKSALKNACVVKWNIAAGYADKPTAKNIYPNWEQVEYAITLFISNWVKAIVDANKAVKAPINVIKVRTLGAYSKRGDNLHTIKTPAVTIVAACINAETGVGPSIASGNHVCKKSWADLPIAPIKSKKHDNSITFNLLSKTTILTSIIEGANSKILSNIIVSK